MNVALQVALAEFGSLEPWDGYCGELVDAVRWEVGDCAAVWVELAGHPRWRWHTAAVIGGVVHCAWFPGLMLPPAEYVAQAFPDTCSSWEVLGPDGTAAETSATAAET